MEWTKLNFYLLFAISVEHWWNPVPVPVCSAAQHLYSLYQLSVFVNYYYLLREWVWEKSIRFGWQAQSGLYVPLLFD